MARRLLRTRVGASRISHAMDPSELSYTRDIRKQMEVIEQNLSEVVRQFTESSPEILLEALQPTFEKSQLYVPKDTGELEKSAYLEVVNRSNGATVEMGYAKGGFPHYAVWVHELTSYFHEAPTRAKFLQAALEEDIEAIQARIVAGYRRIMGE